MIIGAVKEIKDEEYRVGLTPEGVDDLVRLGHQVLVEGGAGAGSGFPDATYEQHGATIVPAAAGVWAAADLIVKVKEPLAPEFGLSCVQTRRCSLTSISPPRRKQPAPLSTPARRAWPTRPCSSRTGLSPC
jgi:NAD/NADP transhydrogenase alpha subunit